MHLENSVASQIGRAASRRQIPCRAGHNPGRNVGRRVSRLVLSFCLCTFLFWKGALRACKLHPDGFGCRGFFAWGRQSDDASSTTGVGNRGSAQTSQKRRLKIPRASDRGAGSRRMKPTIHMPSPTSFRPIRPRSMKISRRPRAVAAAAHATRHFRDSGASLTDGLIGSPHRSPPPRGA